MLATDFIQVFPAQDHFRSVSNETVWLRIFEQINSRSDFFAQPLSRLVCWLIKLKKTSASSKALKPLGVELHGTVLEYDFAHEGNSLILLFLDFIESKMSIKPDSNAGNLFETEETNVKRDFELQQLLVKWQWAH